MPRIFTSVTMDSELHENKEFTKHSDAIDLGYIILSEIDDSERDEVIDLVCRVSSRKDLLRRIKKNIRKKNEKRRNINAKHNQNNNRRSI